MRLKMQDGLQTGERKKQRGMYEVTSIDIMKRKCACKVKMYKTYLCVKKKMHRQRKKWRLCEMSGHRGWCTSIEIKNI